MNPKISLAVSLTRDICTLDHLSHSYLFHVNILCYKWVAGKSTLTWVPLFSKLNIHRARCNRNMIKNLKCANLAKSKVKKLWELNLDTTIFYHKVVDIDWAIWDLIVRCEMVRLMNCSKWLATHRTIDYWLSIWGGRANSHSIDDFIYNFGNIQMVQWSCI